MPSNALDSKESRIQMNWHPCAAVAMAPGGGKETAFCVAACCACAAAVFLSSSDTISSLKTE